MTLSEIKKELELLQGKVDNFNLSEDAIDKLIDDEYGSIEIFDTEYFSSKIVKSMNITKYENIGNDLKFQSNDYKTMINNITKLELKIEEYELNN